MPVHDMESPKYQLAPREHVNGHVKALTLADTMYWSVMYADEDDPIKLLRREPDKQVDLVCELHAQDLEQEPHAELAIRALRNKLRGRL